jgi:ribose-phosphate pyrophosphokinase
MGIKFLAKVEAGWQIISRLEVMKFPAGEVHIKIPENYAEVPVAAYVTGAELDDYMALAQWADIVHQQGEKAIAFIPYLPGARQDRGKPFGAKVYADLINAAGLDKVVCFDPHSHVMPELINNLEIVNSDHVLKTAVLGRSGYPGDYVGVICPDEGAHERTERVAKTLNLPVFYAKKHRDFQTGKLTGFECEPVPETGRLLVVDDICDGGGTFMGLADAINVDRERLTLWVSHGVFSGRANQLTEKYGQIYTTDSHPGATRADVGARVTPLLPYLMVNHLN